MVAGIPLTSCGTCSEMQGVLMGTVKELEAFLGNQQLEWNRRRLLGYVEGLASSIGTSGLDSSLGSLLLRGRDAVRLHPSHARAK